MTTTGDRPNRHLVHNWFLAFLKDLPKELNLQAQLIYLLRQIGDRVGQRVGSGRGREEVLTYRI